VAGSNLGRGTGQPDLFLGFPHALQGNILTVHTQRPLSSTFLPVCHLDMLHAEHLGINIILEAQRQAFVVLIFSLLLQPFKAQ
jgi:hypothetical protein